MQKRAALVRPNTAEHNLTLVKLALRHGRGVSVTLAAPVTDQDPNMHVQALEVPCDVGCWSRVVRMHGCTWIGVHCACDCRGIEPWYQRHWSVPVPWYQRHWSVPSSAQSRAPTQHLGKALDRCPDTIRNLHITLGSRYHVDLNGAITLDAADPWQAWTRWLTLELQPDKCHARAALLARQRSLEAGVELGLGLRMLYCLPELQVGLSCLTQTHSAVASFLVWTRVICRIVRHIVASHRRITGFPSLPAAARTPQPARTRPRPPAARVSPPLLSVCVAPTLPFPPRASAGVELDTTKGLLWVGVDSGDAPLDSPEALHEALRDAAPQAARAAAAKQREADTTARLQRQVERALRLRRLVREVPVDRFSAACARLVSHAPQLMPLLESTSVVISEGFGVASDGAFVRIPWDFEV